MAHTTWPPTLNLDLDLARTFVAICESGNFSRAGERVHRSASAISLQVKKLEEMLGRELFVREARSVAPTGDGEVLLGYARRLIRLNDEAVARFLTPAMTGSVRLGVPNDSGMLAVPAILKRFAATHPDVEVVVKLDRTQALKALSEQGDLDVAIFSDEAASDRPVVHEEELVWVGARGGFAREKRPLPLALADAGCTWRGRALKALDEAGFSYRVAYSSEFCQGQLAAVKADLAVAPLPLSTLGDDLLRLGSADGFPPLGTYRMRLYIREGADPAAQALATHVADSVRRTAETGQRLFA